MYLIKVVDAWTVKTGPFYKEKKVYRTCWS